MAITAVTIQDLKALAQQHGVKLRKNSDGDWIIKYYLGRELRELHGGTLGETAATILEVFQHGNRGEN